MKQKLKDSREKDKKEKIILLRRQPRVCTLINHRLQLITESVVISSVDRKINRSQGMTNHGTFNKQYIG